MRLCTRLQLAVLCAQLVACGGASGTNGPSGFPSSPGNPSNPASGGYIVLTTPSNSIEAGKTVQLKATVYDAGAGPSSDQRVSWVSSNAAAAKVDANGLVTGVAAGTATITVSSVAKAGVTANAVITVTAAVPPFVGTIYVGAEREPFPGGPTSYEIVAVDPNTGTETKLTTDRFDDVNPIPSPDGQYVLFFSNRFVPDSEFLVMKRDGTGIQRLFLPCYFYDGSWPFPYCASARRRLSDSRLLFVVDDFDPQNRTVRGLYARNPVAQSNQAMALPANVPLDASFSPNGDVALFAGSGASLFVVRLADGRTTQIAGACAFPTTCRFIAWAAGGGAIYAARDGSIMQIPIDGSPQTRLYAATSGEFGAMATSPDGARLAFVEGTSVRILTLSSSSNVRTLMTGAPDQIAWSPNSTSVAFTTSTTDFQSQATAINIDGTGRRDMAKTRLMRGIGWGR